MRAKTPRRVIPVCIEIVRLLGRDHIAALYFQQLTYYDTHEPKDGEGYFVKSKADIENDTALTRFQQDRARKKLVERGCIKAANAAFKLMKYPY